MDGWMDGWMGGWVDGWTKGRKERGMGGDGMRWDGRGKEEWRDGEVLIIGKVVGWSGVVPEGLPSVKVRCGPWHFFLRNFGKTFFFFDLFRCWLDFGKVLEPKTEAKIDFHFISF